MLLAGCGGTAGQASSSSAAAPRGTGEATPAGQARPVKIGVATLTGISIIPYVGADAGIWQKHGIDANINFTKDGPTTMTTLLSGDIQFALQSDPSIVQADLQGADAEWLAVSTPRPHIYLVSQPNIDSVEALKGKKIGVTTLASYTALIVRYTLKQHGLDPTKDVQLLAVGGGPQTLAALMTNQVDAIIAAPEEDTAGKKVLVDYTKGDLVFPQGGFAARKSFVQGNQALVQDVVQSYYESVVRSKTDQALGEAETKKLLKLDDPTLIHSTWVGAAGAMSTDIVPTTTELQTVLDLLSDSNPKAASAKATDFFDDTFAKKAVATKP